MHGFLQHNPMESTRFFQELSSGAPKDIALQKAINAYLKEGTVADQAPDHWANLTLTGVVTPFKKRASWIPLGLGLLAAVIGIGAAVWKKREELT